MFVQESTGIGAILGLASHLRWNYVGWKKPVISQHEEVKREFLQYTNTPWIGYLSKEIIYKLKLWDFQDHSLCQVVALSLKDLATAGYFKFVAPDPKVFCNMVSKFILDRSTGNISKYISNTSEISCVSFLAEMHSSIAGVKSLTCPSFTNVFSANIFYIKQ